MIVDDLNLIFCHVPKTAGNTLSKHIWSFWSQDEFSVAGHQDGKNRFELTRNQACSDSGARYKKHMRIKDYQQVVKLNDFVVITVFRDPVERLLSLFFSPHRWLIPKKRARVLKKLSDQFDLGLDFTDRSFKHRKAIYKRQEFERLVHESKSFSNFMEGYTGVSNLIILRFGHLAEDLEAVAPRIGVPKQVAARTRTVYLNQSANLLTQKKQIAEAKGIVLNSHHAEDYQMYDHLRRNFKQVWDESGDD